MVWAFNVQVNRIPSVPRRVPVDQKFESAAAFQSWRPYGKVHKIFAPEAFTGSLALCRRSGADAGNEFMVANKRRILYASFLLAAPV